MKIIANVFLAAIISLIVAYGVTAYMGNQTVTKKEFRKAHRFLNRRIDTLNLKLDKLDYKVNRIERNQDSLKQGQAVIYTAVKEEAQKARVNKNENTPETNDFFDRLIEALQ